MGKSSVIHIVVLVLAFLATLFLFWLGSEFRNDGLFGTIQEILSFLFVLPFAAGAILTGNPHSTNELVFFVTLFLQSYAVIAAAVFLIRRS